jgi:hypothetical protein
VALGVAGAVAFAAGLFALGVLAFFFFFAAAGFAPLVFFEARFFMVANSTAGFGGGSTGVARSLTPLGAAT